MPTIEEIPDPEWSRQIGSALKTQRPGRRNWVLSLIDGPNMSNLGKGAGRGGRDPRTYGAVTSLQSLTNSMVEVGRGLGITLISFNSYHEGEIVNYVYENGMKFDGFLVNPAALTRFGVPFKSALTDVRRPFVELHFSNISAIGWSGGTTTPSAAAVVMGLRQYSYLGALFGFVCALDAGRIPDVAE